MVVIEMDRTRKAEIDFYSLAHFLINTKVKDPRIGFITITDAKLSADFKWLDVFVSIMGEDAEINRSMEGLKNCCGFIKKNLHGRLKLKSIPDIRFLYDKSIDKGIKISKILETMDKDK